MARSESLQANAMTLPPVARPLCLRRMDCSANRFRALRRTAGDSAPAHARVPLVPAKGTKARVPTGGLARRLPHQVPGSEVVLGVGLRRRPWRRSPCSTSCLAPHCARHPIRPPAKGTGTGSLLRSIAAMSRSDEPYGIPCTRAGVAPARRGWLAMDGQPRPVTTGTSCQADPEHKRYVGARPARAGAGVGCTLFGSFLWASRERDPHRSQRSVRSASNHGCGTMSIFGHSATRENHRASEFPLSMSIRCVAVHTQWKPLVLTTSRSGGLLNA